MSDDLDAIRALATRFFDAVQDGNVDTLEAIYDPQVEIWHNTDRATVSREDNLRTLRGFIARAPKRLAPPRRWGGFRGGLVQQPLCRAEKRKGKVPGPPACIVCAVAGGRITRLDEYFDSAALADWLA